MAFIEIRPISHPLQVSVRLPGSKSLTNRALLIAALAEGTSRLENALFSDDSRYFARSLQELGFAVRLDEAAQAMTVSGQGGRIPSRGANLYIGNAGTAARFLTAFLTLGRGEFTLDGDARMRRRPIGDLVTALVQLGAAIRGTGSVVVDPAALCPPLAISAAGLSGGQTSVAGNLSSQFLSGLLMVAPYARNPVEIRLTTELNSRPYVDMTLAVMSDFGLAVERHSYERFVLRPGKYQACADYAIEPDASAASYFFAAPALLGGSVRVEGLTRGSQQGDLAFLDILQAMGCTIREGSGWIEVRGPPTLHGVDVNLCDIPDTAQTLAAIAPFASTPTRIRGIASARVKETDRVAAVCAELAGLGVQVEEYEDGLTILPCANVRPGLVQTYKDHRMAMAFALVGLRVPGIRINDPGCVAKTFPHYFGVLETLR
ncbi:MAG: 3-phosphoshikimate 1-carboxyvinyltransferase [Anaerolineales bacterium]|nr:3-phosphoshikimate 1-carboxyvinyltransferase [Anaerolineales bacterium]